MKGFLPALSLAATLHSGVGQTQALDATSLWHPSRPPCRSLDTL